MNRAPAPPSNFVRGKSGQAPFWPGGLDESLGLDEEAADRQGFNQLQSIPPGFLRGMRLPGEVDDTELDDLQQQSFKETALVIVAYIYVNSTTDRLQPNSIPVGRNTAAAEMSEVDELLPISVSWELESTIHVH